LRSFDENNDVWLRTLSGIRKIRFTSETIEEKPGYPVYQDVETGDYYCWDDSKGVAIVCFPSTGKEIINTDEDDEEYDEGNDDDDDDKMIKVKMDFKIKIFE
jgi:hypothetical protein